MIKLIGFLKDLIDLSKMLKESPKSVNTFLLCTISSTLLSTIIVGYAFLKFGVVDGADLNAKLHALYVNGLVILPYIAMLFIINTITYFISMNSKINIKIVAVDAIDERNKIFSRLPAPQKTYYVYGIGLASITADDNRLNAIKGYVDKKINVVLCMANPEIFRDDVVCKEDACKVNIRNNVCKVINHYGGEKLPHNIEDVQKLLDRCYSFFKCVPHEYKTLFERKYLNKYLNKYSDYYEDIKNSFKNIDTFIDKVGNSDIHGRINFRQIDTFIPLSITIVDGENDSGRLVVEYILPYIGHRLILDIERKRSPTEFGYFVDLFKKICENSSLVKSNKQEYEIT